MIFGALQKLEQVLQNVIESNPVLRSDRIEPLDIVKQVESEIERNKKIFVNNKIYIAHKIVINLYAPTPEKVDEYEALFNHPIFLQHVKEYIESRGYELLAKIRVVMKCHAEWKKEFGKRACYVEFYWPTPEADPGDVTIRVEPNRPDHIEEVRPPKPDAVPAALLETVVGETREPRLTVTRKATYLGRLEQVLDPRTGRIVRTNDVVFLKTDQPDGVNTTVSRQHAKIVYENDGFFLYDTGSENGTSVEKADGRKIELKPRTPRQEGVALGDGDVIGLGEARVRFSRNV